MKRLSPRTRLRKEIANVKKRGKQPSPWLLRRCLKDAALCEEVLPGIRPLLHPHLDIVASLNIIMKKYMELAVKARFEQQSKFYDYISKYKGETK